MIQFEINLILGNIFHDLHSIVSFEGGIVENYHVKHDSQRPHITFFIILLVQHLRSYVVGSSHSSTQKLSRPDFLRDSKIYNLHQFGSLLKQNIFGFDIAMDDASTMQII